MLLRRNCVWAALACVLVSACGGGGGGGGSGVDSTPPPPPPPPAPQASYASFNNLASDQQIALTGATKVTTGTGPASVVSRPFADGTLSLTYNAATGTYTLRTDPYTMSFGAADARSDALGPAFKTYQKVDGNTTDVSGIYRPAGNPGGDSATYLVPLSYTTLIARARVTSNPEGPQTRQDSFLVGGFPTLASDMPRSGLGSYAGNLRALQNNSLFIYSGTARLLADFAALTVRADLHIDRPDLTYVSLTGNGTISSVRFNGPLAGNGFTGTFDGSFFGPQAAEMGYSFIVQHADGTVIGGAAAGSKL